MQIVKLFVQNLQPLISFIHKLKQTNWIMRFQYFFEIRKENFFSAMAITTRKKTCILSSSLVVIKSSRLPKSSSCTCG